MDEIVSLVLPKSLLNVMKFRTATVLQTALDEMVDSETQSKEVSFIKDFYMKPDHVSTEMIQTRMALMIEENIAMEIIKELFATEDDNLNSDILPFAVAHNLFTFEDIYHYLKRVDKLEYLFRYYMKHPGVPFYTTSGRYCDSI